MLFPFISISHKIYLFQKLSAKKKIFEVTWNGVYITSISVSEQTFSKKTVV